MEGNQPPEPEGEGEQGDQPPRRPQDDLAAQAAGLMSMMGMSQGAGSVLEGFLEGTDLSAIVAQETPRSPPGAPPSGGGAPEPEPGGGGAPLATPRGDPPPPPGARELQALLEQFGDPAAGAEGREQFEELMSNPQFRVLMNDFIQNPDRMLEEMAQRVDELEEEDESEDDAEEGSEESEESSEEDEEEEIFQQFEVRPFGEEEEDDDETPPQRDREEAIREMAADADRQRIERESLSRTGGLFDESSLLEASFLGGPGASSVDLDDLFNPEKVTNFPHTVRTHATESLDTLEQMLFSNVFGSGFSPTMREDVAWQLALAVRQAATEHGEAADVLLSQLRARGDAQLHDRPAARGHEGRRLPHVHLREGHGQERAVLAPGHAAEGRAVAEPRGRRAAGRERTAQHGARPRNRHPQPRPCLHLDVQPRRLHALRAGGPQDQDVHADALLSPRRLRHLHATLPQQLHAERLPRRPGVGSAGE